MRRWEHRGYEAHVPRDLFGQWQVVRVWGGVGRAHGACRCDPVSDPLAGHQAVAEIARRRVRRGYLPVAL
jgi:hypothetical protein